MLPKRNWSQVLICSSCPFSCFMLCTRRSPPSHGIFSVVSLQQQHGPPPDAGVFGGQQVICEEQGKSQDRRPPVCFCCVCGNFGWFRRGIRTGLPCDSIGSVASRSKSCLLFVSPCLMPHCLVLTAFFKNVIKILCNAP